jgi:hypothetical protein
MPEAASSAQIHLGTGPRHLWNVWPKTTQKGFLIFTLLKIHFIYNYEQ